MNDETGSSLNITLDPNRLIERGFKLDSDLTQAMHRHAISANGTEHHTIYTAAMVAQQFYAERIAALEAIVQELAYPAACWRSPDTAKAFEALHFSQEAMQ